MNCELTSFFILNSIMLGIGLAMDAFSVSLANGLTEPHMRKRRYCAIAGVFGFFQGFMPMVGWLCVHTIAQSFHAFEKWIPWIALILLLSIGGKMLIEGIRGTDSDVDMPLKIGSGALLIQGIATSIDALSVGFTIAEYGFMMALVCATIIAVITFIISICGLIIGRKIGTTLADKASILGGGILIAIGIEIFFSS